MNKVKIQLRAFQNLDAQGNKIASEMYGFTISDDSKERTYAKLTFNEFIILARNPQYILDRTMEYWSSDFQNTILFSRGFFLNGSWYDVNSSGKIIDHSYKINIDDFVASLHKYYLNAKSFILKNVKTYYKQR